MPSYGTGILERKIEGYDVEIDGSNSTLSASVPEKIYPINEIEEIIYTNPVDLLRMGAKPSFSVIRFAKVKNFIDGIYATIEERINEKGHKLSRSDFLNRLRLLTDGKPKEYISSAIERRSNEPETIIQGFYDWNDELRIAYRQIKSLSKNLDSKSLNNLIDIIRDNPELKEAYEGISTVYAKMTGKPKNEYSLFSPAEIPDQELFKKISEETQGDISEGLGKALVQAIKSRRIDFTPEEDSGLYIRQMNEIVPLILRETPEFKRFIIDEEYEKILEDEFISQWAGTRHTHIGHTDFGEMLYGSSIIPERPLIIKPDLPIEPFASSYQRMRENIEFLERTITKHIPEVLDKKRLMNDSSRAKIPIGEELNDMKLILEGLELISMDSIHLPYKRSNPEEAISKASDWLKNIEKDPDLNRNTAIFVPIIRTTDGSRQISYINAGFKPVEVTASYEKKPSIKVNREESWNHEFEEKYFILPYLVHRETRIPHDKLINDSSLRELLNGTFTEAELDAVIRDLEK